MAERPYNPAGSSLMQAVFDASPSITIVFDGHFNPIDCNAAAMSFFEFNSRELALKNLAAALDQETLPCESEEWHATTLAERLRYAEKQGGYEYGMTLLVQDDLAPLWCSITRIPIEGGSFVLVFYAIDLRKVKASRQVLVTRDRLYKIIHENIAPLQLADIGPAKGEGFDRAVWEYLRQLGRCIRVNRATIWENYTDDETGLFCCRQLYEWVENAVPTMGWEITHRTVYNDIPELRDTLMQNEIVNDFVRNRPLGEQKYLSGQGIQAFLVIPIFIQGQFWGWMDFEDCEQERFFSEDVEHVLHFASLLLGSVILRRLTTAGLINAREEALREAERSNMAKSDFLATMSHEIRTPLNAILGLAEVELQKRVAEGTETALLPMPTRINLEKIYASGSTLLGIINDILDISKIEAGNLSLVCEDYTFASFVNDTIQVNLVRIGSKPIEFELEVDDAIPAQLHGDELRVKQILNNLLSNAIKYTRTGKVTLRISYIATGDKALLTFAVADTGQGIRQEDVGQLFARYRQLNSRVNRNIEGTGLGLSITKNLAEMMGGTITVESEFGKGSVFTVTIPQRIVDPAPIGNEAAENLRKFRFHETFRRKELPPFTVRGGKVLVVDDVSINLDVAQAIMEAYSLTVDCVTSGREAIEKIASGETAPETERYDIIFMDHMMPEMDGIETTALIRGRESDYAKKVPIVALTANALAGNREMFLQNGIDDFLAKPIDQKKLVDILRQWIAPEKYS